MNPKLVVCYICGREFGSLSINIHSPKCLEKWRIENNKLPKSQRRPDPVKPQLQKELALGRGGATLSELQRQNEAAYAAAKDAMLSTCDNCQRRFLPPQLVRHQKACRPGVTTFKRTPSARALRPRPKRVRIIKMPPGHIPGPLGRGGIQSTIRRHLSPPISRIPAGPLRATDNFPSTSTSRHGPAVYGERHGQKGPESRRPPPSVRVTTAPPAASVPVAAMNTVDKSSFSRPPTRVCYICGREFGSKSIDIHEPQCLDKWRVQNAKLPSALRKLEPQKPDVLQGDGFQRLTADQINAMAYETFKSNLAQCTRCNRRFLPDRLIVHARSCRV